MEKGGFKMFNIVSSWNKRRRSRSLDQLNPWVYKPAELWQTKEQSPPPKKRNCTMVFTLKEMEEATNMFSDRNLIGKGGFGRVYRGVLKDDRCHQEDGPAHLEAGRRRARVPGGDRHPEQARPPQPGDADRLLRRREAPVRGLRVHAQRQPPGHPQWHWGGEDGLAAAAADRAGRSEGAGVPALQHGRRRPRRPPGLQVQQHPAHRALRGQDLGFRAREADAAGPGPAHDHQGPGHVRLFRPRIRADGEADAAERRVRVRGGAAGAADGAARHRPEPAGDPGAEPHRGDPPGGGRPQEAAPGGGPGHGQGFLHGGVGVHVRRPRRAVRVLRRRRQAVHAGLRQGAPVHHVRQHEDMSMAAPRSLDRVWRRRGTRVGFETECAAAGGGLELQVCCFCSVD